MSTSNKRCEELVNIIRSLSCPLIVRNDAWWIEELLFKPGKPRTSLLVWVISMASTNLSYSQDFQDSNSSSVDGIYFKIPETDEEILDTLCRAGACSSKDLPFVKGEMKNEEQLKFWERLIKPLQCMMNPTINTEISFGHSMTDDIISRDNFYDIFTMSADLLPNDIKSDLERFSKTRDAKSLEGDNIPRGKPSFYDEEFARTCLEQSATLKTEAEKFISMFNTDLKISLPETKCSGKMLRLDEDATKILINKCYQSKEAFDALLELQNKFGAASAVERKTEALLERTLKDKSFEPFNNLCNDS